MASNPPAERSQISVQPRDVLLLLLLWSCWYQDGRVLRQVKQCRDPVHAHVPICLGRIVGQRAANEWVPDRRPALGTRGGLRQSQWLAVDGDTVASLCAPVCVSLPGQPRDDGEVDVGRSQ